MAVGKKSMVTISVRSAGREKKAADELSDLHSHDLILVAAGLITMFGS